MLLIELQQHLSNNGVYHCFRKEDYIHDVYKNPINGMMVTIPIKDTEIMDEFAGVACAILGIEMPDGTIPQQRSEK